MTKGRFFRVELDKHKRMEVQIGIRNQGWCNYLISPAVALEFAADLRKLANKKRARRKAA